MNQATLKSNEFIIAVDETPERIVYRLRNPHVEPGQSGHYDLVAYAIMEATLRQLPRLRPFLPKLDEPIINDDDSSTEYDD